MRAVIQYFIKYPITSNVLLGLTVLFGIYNMGKLRSTFFPERPSRFIAIQAVYPGASPGEVEEGIVLKIEDNLKGITGIKEISSVSSENTGSVTIEVEEGYDTDVALQDVKNAVDRISSFPSGMEPPSVFKRENISVAVTFALSGEGLDLKALKQYARQVENDLRGVKGISKIELAGFPDEEIEISVREDDLRKFMLTFEQVTLAVRKANLEITGGTIKGMEEEMLIRARSKNYFAEKLENIVVKSNESGTTIRLKDVASIEDKWADSPNRSYMNGAPSVQVIVSNTVEEDILFISDYLKQYIQEFNEKNQAVQATLIRDAAVIIRQRIDLLLNNGITGSILVLVFLSLFLNYRMAFWVALGIPISFLGMFIIANLYGITINAISLFGMIIVVGILVDDGIVIAENVYQHYERGKTSLRAAIDGTMEVLPAVVSAIVTTVLAFSIFFFLQGRIGEIVRDLAFVVIVTLLFSLIEAFLILPGHVAHSKAMARDLKQAWLEKQTTRFMDWMRTGLYSPLLAFSMRNRSLALSIPVGLMMISIGAIQGGFVKTTFFPVLESDFVSVSLTMPAGTATGITNQWLSHIEEATWEVNETLKSQREDGLDVVLFVDTRLGPNTHTGSLNISLLDGETRNMRSFEITNAIRDNAGAIPGAENVTFGERGVFGKPVSLSLLGNNFEELNKAKLEVKAELNKIEALKDVVDTDQEGLREIDIRLRDKAYLLGLTLQDVLTQVRQGFFGSEVQRLQRGLDEVKVWVRYRDSNRTSMGNLEEMLIRTANGQTYPLREIASFEIKRGIIAINHLNGRREIKIEADMGDPTASVTDVIADIADNVVAPILAKYPSVSVEYGGQSKSASDTTGSAALVVPIIFLLIFAVIAITFRSFRQATIVFMIVPFGFIGVVFGHFVHGVAISILSVYGILALVGIMVNDSLVLISAMNNNMKSGLGFYDALYQAGISRFRAIILTSVTTIAGLGPLIAETSFQAKFLIPMAISVAYGLGMATFLTLITLPVLIAAFDQIHIYLVWLWEGKKPVSEELQPAIREMKQELLEKEPMNP
jgi:multidrug efflux pump subunit AcrB